MSAATRQRGRTGLGVSAVSAGAAFFTLAACPDFTENFHRVLIA
jgi:hypothetical protein